MTTCTICGKEWKTPTKRVLEGKTCTRKCAAIKGFLARKQKETDIEKKVRLLLDRIGVPYVAQIPLKGFCVPDFVVCNKVVVFCDGEYFHSKPKKKYKDSVVTNRLIKKGYTVLRFSGEQIHKHIRKVRKDILSALPEETS